MSSAEITWDSGVEPVLEDRAVSRAVEAALDLGGRPGAVVSVVFVDDETLAGLHAEHLGDPERTDVITFDLGDEGEGPVGELFVSVDRARILAERRKVPVARELTLYVVHGVLHLCGYDDHTESDRAAMRAAEARVLSGLGFEPDARSHDFGAD